MAAAFVAEMFLTMLLVFTVLGATDDRAPAGFAAIPIGLILTIIILAGIPVTNGSFNPARSIGPAVLVGGWAIATTLAVHCGADGGGALAAVLYRTIRMPGPLISAKQAEQAFAEPNRAERRQTKSKAA